MIVIADIWSVFLLKAIEIEWVISYIPTIIFRPPLLFLDLFSFWFIELSFACHIVLIWVGNTLSIGISWTLWIFTWVRCLFSWNSSISGFWLIIWRDIIVRRYFDLFALVIIYLGLFSIRRFISGIIGRLASTI